MSKCWYCNEELISGDNPKHFGICNKCYDEMFKSDEQKHVDMLYKENSELLVNSLVEKDKQIAELQKQLEEKEKIIEHWHNLYKKRDQQFQSVRQRYHLLNKLQSNYNKKDKLHLLEMQCLELVKENEELEHKLEVQR